MTLQAKSTAANVICFYRERKDAEPFGKRISSAWQGGTDMDQKNKEKIIAACGNDCTACPRYIAAPYEKTDEQLHHTADLWKRIGYRDRIVSNEEISCRGCTPENFCRFQVVRCAFEKGVSVCSDCAEYPCENILACFETTKTFQPACRRECTDEEYAMIEKAFFMKRENLESLRRGKDSLSFIPLLADDSSGIAGMSSMAKEIVREHFDPIIGKAQNDYMIAKFQTEESIADQLAHGYRYYFVRISGRNAGFMAFYPRGNAMYLSKFYLYKDQRGKGYASKMLDFVIKKTKEEGLHAIELNVNRNNSAVQVYEKLGFRIIRQEKNDIGEGFFMDDYVFRYDLD